MQSTYVVDFQSLGQPCLKKVNSVHFNCYSVISFLIAIVAIVTRVILQIERAHYLSMQSCYFKVKAGFFVVVVATTSLGNAGAVPIVSL